MDGLDEVVLGGLDRGRPLVGPVEAEGALEVVLGVGGGVPGGDDGLLAGRNPRLRLDDVDRRRGAHVDPLLGLVEQAGRELEALLGDGHGAARRDVVPIGVLDVAQCAHDLELEPGETLLAQVAGDDDTGAVDRGSKPAQQRLGERKRQVRVPARVEEDVGVVRLSPVRRGVQRDLRAGRERLRDPEAESGRAIGEDRGALEIARGRRPVVVAPKVRREQGVELPRLLEDARRGSGDAETSDLEVEVPRQGHGVGRGEIEVERGVRLDDGSGDLGGQSRYAHVLCRRSHRHQQGEAQGRQDLGAHERSSFARPSLPFTKRFRKGSGRGPERGQRSGRAVTDPRGVMCPLPTRRGRPPERQSACRCRGPWSPA